jgi:hypothetical protein
MRNLLVLAAFVLGGVAGPFVHHVLVLHEEPTGDAEIVARLAHRAVGPSETAPHQSDDPHWHVAAEDCPVCASFLLSTSGLSSPYVEEDPPEAGSAAIPAVRTDDARTSRRVLSSLVAKFYIIVRSSGAPHRAKEPNRSLLYSSGISPCC